MNCPNCKIPMRQIKRNQIETYKGKEVVVSYIAEQCPKCFMLLIDGKSLDDSWNKIREEHG